MLRKVIGGTWIWGKLGRCGNACGLGSIVRKRGHISSVKMDPIALMPWDGWMVVMSQCLSFWGLLFARPCDKGLLTRISVLILPVIIFVFQLRDRTLEVEELAGGRIRGGGIGIFHHVCEGPEDMLLTIVLFETQDKHLCSAWLLRSAW